MEHKQGDTFDYLTIIPSTFEDGHFSGWTVLSQVRHSKTGALVATLSTSWEDPATTRTLRLLALDTAGWPLAQLELDVQFTRTSDGYVMSTNTQLFALIRDVTRP